MWTLIQTLNLMEPGVKTLSVLSWFERNHCHRCVDGKLAACLALRTLQESRLRRSRFLYCGNNYRVIEAESIIKIIISL